MAGAGGQGRGQGQGLRVVHLITGCDPPPAQSMTQKQTTDPRARELEGLDLAVILEARGFLHLPCRTAQDGIGVHHVGFDLCPLLAIDFLERRE